METIWERGREVMQRSLELLNTGEKEQALKVLDGGLAEAIQQNQGSWVRILCHHAAVIAHSMQDRRRQITYEEQALPFAKEYRFAAYSFAQLLLRDGQIARAERYAIEAYKLCVAGATEGDHDLVAAILKQWPNAAQSQ
jgi:hypothetical protein